MKKFRVLRTVYDPCRCVYRVTPAGNPDWADPKEDCPHCNGTGRVLFVVNDLAWCDTPTLHAPVMANVVFVENGTNTDMRRAYDDGYFDGFGELESRHRGGEYTRNAYSLGYSDGYRDTLLIGDIPI